jgi:hypothetical protein
MCSHTGAETKKIRKIATVPAHPVNKVKNLLQMRWTSELGFTIGKVQKFAFLTHPS